jgi:hypothetical protein
VTRAIGIGPGTFSFDVCARDDLGLLLPADAGGGPRRALAGGVTKTVAIRCHGVRTCLFGKGAGPSC